MLLHCSVNSTMSQTHELTPADYIFFWCQKNLQYDVTRPVFLNDSAKIFRPAGHLSLFLWTCGKGICSQRRFLILISTKKLTLATNQILFELTNSWLYSGSCSLLPRTLNISRIRIGVTFKVVENRSVSK